MARDAGPVDCAITDVGVGRRVCGLVLDVWAMASVGSGLAIRGGMAQVLRRRARAEEAGTMKRKKTMEDRMLEEMGVEIVDGSQVGRAGSIPVVGTLSKHTTPEDFRRFERIAGLRQNNKDN